MVEHNSVLKTTLVSCCKMVTISQVNTSNDGMLKFCSIVNLFFLRRQRWYNSFRGNIFLESLFMRWHFHNGFYSLSRSSSTLLKWTWKLAWIWLLCMVLRALKNKTVFSYEKLLYFLLGNKTAYTENNKHKYTWSGGEMTRKSEKQQQSPVAAQVYNHIHCISMYLRVMYRGCRIDQLRWATARSATNEALATSWKPESSDGLWWRDTDVKHQCLTTLNQDEHDL